MFIFTVPDLYTQDLFPGRYFKLNHFTLLLKILQWLLSKVKIHCDIEGPSSSVHCFPQESHLSPFSPFLALCP